MQDPVKVHSWRRVTWIAFSIVFFTQLGIGLAGDQRFLMTGKLHLPVPMMILGGPIYRGNMSVMTILFISTVVLSGPAWCSHLCYIGAWDGLAATARRRGGSLSAGWTWLRFAVFAATPVLAVLLRFFRVSGLSAGIMICYAVTMLTVPSLVMALDYQKKGEIKVKEKLGNVPVNHRKKIIALAVIFVLISVILIPQVQANMDFIKMAPQDEPVIIKMREYSEKFGGGQQGMVMVTGMVPSDDNVHGSMIDPNVLYEVDRLEAEINKVENTKRKVILKFTFF